VKLAAEWRSDLRRAYADDPLVNDARVGVFYTAVELSSGQVGVAFTPRDLSDSVCCPKTAAQAPPAGRLSGISAWQLADYALSPSPLKRALGVAALNALSAAAIERRGLRDGVLRRDLDALDAAEIAPDDRVVMVGAFIPFIKKLKGRVASLKVIDKHRDALKPEEQALWSAPDQAAEALGSGSVVILTGSSLVEGGIEELLGYSKAARVRVMAGPTTPLWARPFFERGVNILGGVQVIDGSELLTIVGQGGSGYLFESVARKVCVIGSSLAASVPRDRAAG
jgi:uncharacterized protein (DUF4213/DUF364 family)